MLHAVVERGDTEQAWLLCPIRAAAATPIRLPTARRRCHDALRQKALVTGGGSGVGAVIARALAEATALPEYLVRLTWYTTDNLKDLGAACRRVLDRHFGNGCGSGRRLMEDAAKIEIEATAVLPAV